MENTQTQINLAGVPNGTVNKQTQINLARCP